MKSRRGGRVILESLNGAETFPQERWAKWTRNFYDLWGAGAGAGGFITWCPNAGRVRRESITRKPSTGMTAWIAATGW